MERKNFLTNEKISKKFKSQFELVNYAIKLAENMILSGREPRVKLDTQNHALQVVAEIMEGKDQLDDLSEDQDASSYEEQVFNSKKVEDVLSVSLEKKKATKQFRSK
jgi:hypothetical protein